MGYKDNKVKLYTSQSKIVLDILKEEHLFVRREFIEKKYGEVSNIFLEAYDWYSYKAKDIVKKPQGAGYPVWAFTEAEYAGYYPGSYLITLEVPIKEIIFFRMEDWNKILNLSYLAKDEKDQEKFNIKIKDYNISNESDAFTKPFYPHIKSEIIKSWDNLFTKGNLLNENNLCKVPLQASLWEIRREWIIEIKEC